MTEDMKIRIGAQDRASNLISRVKQAFAALIGVYIGAKTIQGIKRAAGEFRNYGLEIDKMSKVTGLATESLQRLKYAADQEHSSLEQLQKGLVNLTVRLGYAGDGLETYLRYFRALDIEYKNADGTLRDTYDVFLDISDAVSKGQLSTEEMAATMQLFGARAGKELIPLLKKGSDWFRQMGDEAERLGVVLDDQTIKTIKAFDDAMVKMQTAFKGVAYQLFTPIVKAAEVFARNFAKILEFNKGDIQNWGQSVVSIILQTAQTLLTGMGAFLNEWAEMGKAMLDINMQLIIHNPIRKIFPGDMWERVQQVAQAKLDILAFQKQLLKTTISVSDFFEAWKSGILDFKPLELDLEPPPGPEPPDFSGASGDIDETTSSLEELDKELDKKPPAIDEINDKMKEFLKDIKEGAFQFVQSWADSVIDSIWEGNMAFHEFVRDFISGMAKMMVKLLAFKAIASAFGMPGGLPFFNTGGVVRAQQGIIVPGGMPYVDRVPIMATPGERVLSRGEYGAMGGEAGVQRAMTFNTPVTINVTLGAGSGRQQAQEFLKIVQSEFGNMQREAIRRRL